MDSYKIISNAFVVTCDPYNRGGRYDLLVQNDRIAGVSERAGLLASLYPGAIEVIMIQRKSQFRHGRRLFRRACCARIRQ